MNISVALIFVLLAVTMIIMSIMRDDFTKGQMNIHGQRGYSGVSHLGLWSCLLVIPWLCGIIWTYYQQWDKNEVLLASMLGLAINHLMHSLWLKNGPDDHNIKTVETIIGESTVTRRYRLTGAGIMHYFYMTAVLMLVILFFFFTDNIDHWHLFWVSLILGLHVTLTTLVLNLIRQKKLDTVALLTTLVVWIVLAARLVFA